MAECRCDRPPNRNTGPLQPGKRGCGRLATQRLYAPRFMKENVEPTQSHPPPPSMGGPPPPVPEPLRRPKIGRRKLLAVLAAVAGILGGVSILPILRPRAIVEGLSLDHLPAGGEDGLPRTTPRRSREN